MRALKFNYEECKCRLKYEQKLKYEEREQIFKEYKDFSSWEEKTNCLSTSIKENSSDSNGFKKNYSRRYF